MDGCTLKACHLWQCMPASRSRICLYSSRRSFHDYFVTHLPSSSLHPDSQSPGTHHKLPRSASSPHTPASPKDPSPAPIVGVARDTTVVRIPLRSAKHHFGVSASRGTRPYNEDTYQAGVIELPAFAKRGPVSLTRGPASSPLQIFRDGQRKQQEQQNRQAVSGNDGEGTAAEGASGDPQVFYFGVFDGHGGTECSGFLRESLHKYIEDAAKKFHLRSTLRAPLEKTKVVEDNRVTSVVQEERYISNDGRSSSMKLKSDRELSSESLKSSAPTEDLQESKLNEESLNQGDQEIRQESSVKRVLDLQVSLMKKWRITVGGYFRRFKPPAFLQPGDSESTISNVLTYAFLHADLDFINAQARKSDPESDSVISDAPLNASDVLESPSRQIGGSKRFKGGSTCSLALISTPSPVPFWHPASPSTLIVSHVGDTRILLCKTVDGNAIPVTTDHHPKNTGEAMRLRKYAASFVTDSFGEERISGLANTRAFGDMQSKRIGVSAEPEIRRIELTPAEFSFIVLVSDGISGTLSDQELVDVVKEAKTPEQAAKDVVTYATEVSREGDNATCIVVRLGGWERRSEGGVGSMGTKENRVWRRKEATNPRSRRT